MIAYDMTNIIEIKILSGPLVPGDAYLQWKDIVQMAEKDGFEVYGHVEIFKDNRFFCRMVKRNKDNYCNGKRPNRLVFNSNKEK